MSLYPDTSFLVSLYTLDANSAAAARKMRHAPASLILSDLAELELANALEQRVFRKELELMQIQAGHKAFRDDLEQGVFERRQVETGAVYERALRLSRKWTAKLGTRTLDVLHIAIALEAGAEGILTFDLHQLKLARSIGLKAL